MRTPLAILTTVSIVLSSSQADACCLTDWLFGRTTSPYAVGYAPVATGPQVVGVPPVTVARPVMSAPVMSAPVMSAPVMSSGVYQSQRPAYINNPSVYTGMPVTGNVQATYRVAPAPVTAERPAFSNPLGFRGQTPITTYRPQMQSSVPGQPLTITTPTGTPATAIPTTPVAPMFQPVQPRPVGPIRSFFGRLFGTGYRTSYYRAPVTYYRPVTTVDPISGTTVTVQRPCTSVVQQLQRTPIATVQSMQPGYGAPATNCPTPTYGYSQGATVPSNYGVGQVNAIGTMGQGASQIPSTMPPSSYGTYGGSNAAPLQGAPPANGGTGDYAPMQQPRLESQSPASGGNGNGNGNGNGSNGASQGGAGSNEQPSNYWQLQNADDSTAMIRRSPSSPSASRYAPSNYGSITNPQAPRGQVEPIAAPEEYVSPFRSRSAPAATAQPQPGSFQAPPLPPRSTTDPTELTAVSTRVPAARMPATAPTRRVAPIKRDSTWLPVR